MPTNQPIGIARRLKQARTASGLTLREVGVRLRVHFSWIEALENSRRPLPHEWLFKLADLYGVSPRWLSLGDGEPE